MNLRRIAHAEGWVETSALEALYDCKNGRCRYGMIGETQPEMAVLEKVAFVYSVFAKSSPIPSIARI